MMKKESNVTVLLDTEIALVPTGFMRKNNPIEVDWTFSD